MCQQRIRFLSFFREGYEEFTDTAFLVMYVLSAFSLGATFPFLFGTLFSECTSFAAGLETTLSFSQHFGTLRKVDTVHQTHSRKNYCNLKLCSRSACEEEALIRRSKESSIATENSTIQFSRQKMQEEVFEKIFYSSSSAMKSQKLIVVTTSYGVPPHYPLEWIDLQPWPVFISTKERGFGIASEPWGNVGQEIASYMRFILMFWEDLPENIAFIHGHEKTWHQEGYKMSYMLKHICLKKFGYASLNAFENDAWRLRKGSKSYFSIIRKYWKIVKPYLGDMPRTGFKEKCCAQFVVSRERIQARPRRLYELILEQMTDKKKNYQRAPHGKHSGWDLIHFWEAIWHYVFGEDALVKTRNKYGYGIDKNMESGRPLSKRPERTLKNFIAC
jgi:hypothetical protein